MGQTGDFIENLLYTKHWFDVSMHCQPCRLGEAATSHLTNDDPRGHLIQDHTDWSERSLGFEP